ncbi:hypothetical protein BLAT2472_10150 [Burkholderia latens]
MAIYVRETRRSHLLRNARPIRNVDWIHHDNATHPHPSSSWRPHVPRHRTRVPSAR